MIRAFSYESQGQPQRFEPREHRSGEEQHQRTYLDIHLRLSFHRHQERSSPPNIIYLTRILVALVSATYIISWWMSLVAENDWNIFWPSHFAVSWYILLAGLATAWGASALAGFPLFISAWRSTPRIRFWLLLPLLLFFFIPLTFLLSSSVPFMGIMAWLLNGAFLMIPLISTLLLVSALRRSVIAGNWLRFARMPGLIVEGALILLVLGGFLWYFTLVLVPIEPISFPWSGLLLSLFGLCVTLLVALSAIVHWPRWREQVQAKPKDDFLSSQP